MVSKMTGPLLWLIAVNYHREAETRSFVKAFRALDEANRMQILVVDNTEESNKSQLLHQFDSPNGSVRVLRPGKNIGYFGGAAWGLKKLLEKDVLPDWVAVSNTDICPVDKDFLQILAGISAQQPASVVAPAITAMPSGRQQNPYMRKRLTYARMVINVLLFRSTFLYGVWEKISGLKHSVTNWFRKKMGSLSLCLEPCLLYAPHGSFILFHRSYFEEGGNLDFGAFLFGEEIFIAETARRLGLEVHFEPALALIHQEHAATGLLKNKRMVQYLSESADYLFHTFYRKK